MSTPRGRRVTMVAALAENGVIGAEGNIPWHVPADFQHFKATTSGHVLIVGRTTHEGIGRPLPDRHTIVLTSNRDWRGEGVDVAHDITEALELADRVIDGREEECEVMIGGGSVVYEAALPYADVQVLSEIPVSPEGDTHYPEFDRRRWSEASREPRDGFTVVRWERTFGCGGS
ncbi:dihydrofolate reductase [Nocardioides panacisoli]|uniref:dihydrofolate reductase n=1 Tax=Nocardioides panacisoli TaxID=627624 RepID=UPI001C630478|nr:dihydrofolate reductase [Nocardioides panacisoli]QYJ05321.1 dihydrofolate reductase [Nocardioides panacisoli]